MDLSRWSERKVSPTVEIVILILWGHISFQTMSGVYLTQWTLGLRKQMKIIRQRIPGIFMVCRENNKSNHKINIPKTDKHRLREDDGGYCKVMATMRRGSHLQFWQWQQQQQQQRLKQ